MKTLAHRLHPLAWRTSLLLLGSCIAALLAPARGETSYVEGLGDLAPIDSAVDSAGYTYIAGRDGSVGRLKKIDPSGGVVFDVELSGSESSSVAFEPVSISIGTVVPDSVALLVGPSDAIYLASSSRLILVDPLNGGTVASLDVSAISGSTLTRTIKDVHYTLVSQSGNSRQYNGAVYFAGTRSDGLAIVGKVAADLSAFIGDNAFGHTASGDSANSVVVDEVGDVYVAGGFAAGSNQLGELGLSNRWSIQIYAAPSGTSVNSFEAAEALRSTSPVVNNTSVYTTINFDNNFPNSNTGSSTARRDNFLFIASATFQVTTSGSYTFYGTSDDGQRIYVNDVLVLNDNERHGSTEKASSAVTLEPGFHTIRYEVFENDGSEVAKLNYSTDGGTTKSLLVPATTGGNTGYVVKFGSTLSTALGVHLLNYQSGAGGAYLDMDYANGWIYATGYWSGAADGYDEASTGEDIMTVKLDTSLRLKGRATVQGAANLRGHDVSADEKGNVYLSGRFGPASSEFIANSGTVFTDKSSSVESRFVAKLDSGMNYEWVETDKDGTPDFTVGSTDTDVAWNEGIQRLFLTGWVNNGALTLGNPGQHEQVQGPQGFLAVFEPGGTYTEQVDLTVISQYGQSGTQVLPFGGTPSLPRTERRIKGSQITVSVPEAIYLDIDNVELQNPTNETISNNATTRQRPTGYTLSDGTITDDGQFVYSGLLEEDLTVTFNWITEYALTIELDLSGTVGTQLGQLQSLASGRPEPAVGKNWVARDEQRSPEIDGIIQDIEVNGGAIRYLVAGYKAKGPPNTNVAPGSPGEFTSEDFFPIGTVENRLRLDAFTMEGPATIKWVLIKQNAVQVNTTGPASFGLPYIEVVSDPPTRATLGLSAQADAVGAGTFFFDEHTSLRIMSRVVQGEQQLRGWLAGDGVVFESSGTLSELTLFSIGTVPYRGLAVADLTRPARVMWDYGDRIYEETVTIGNYVRFTDLEPLALGRLRSDLKPDRIDLIDGPEGSSVEDMVLWDDQANLLYPLRPGEVLTYWRTNDVDPNNRILLRLFLEFPAAPHYRHVAETPAVQLDPSEDDLVVFREVKYAENDAAASDDAEFTATTPGRSVLLFGELNEVLRGREFETARVRVVETKNWDTDLPPIRNVPIGRKVTSGFDTAKLDTGYVFFPLARYNPFVHNRDEVIGPVIPVNREFRSEAEHDLVVVWYERRDDLVWPYQAEMLNPLWPTTAQGLGRIVIASELGSDGVDANGLDQEVVGPVTVDVLDDDGNVIGSETVAAATTYDSSRFQQVQVYSQPDPGIAGYNPNEEHGLIAPSRRFATVNPLPDAAFALRDNDLNVIAQGPSYTSDPYVLTQFFDTADEEFKMKVYSVVREASRSNLGSRNYDYRFLVPKGIVAGKPVIPFYPLGQVIGATPCPETFGLDDNPDQLTYWEDHKGGSWSVSGGEDATFKVYFYYPMLPDFWWPENGIPGTNPPIGAKQVGDCLAFLPNLFATGNTSFPDHKPTEIERDNNNLPQPITYASEWPENTPVLKVGETLTFAGGEFKADNPTVLVPDGEGGVREEETPGLPGVLAWAAGEVVYDDLNPDMDDQEAFDEQKFTARIFQALESRSITVDRDLLPATFQPANTQVIRVDRGLWYFAELPASLQKRVFYDPITEKLGIKGLLNDKDIGDPSLTAAPPPLYVLEPNLMTPEEVSALRDLASDSTYWQDAVTALDKLSRNPALLDKDDNGTNNADAQDRFLAGLNKADDGYRVGLERKIKRDSMGEPIEDTDDNGIIFIERDEENAQQAQALGVGLALTANPGFLDPTNTALPDVSYVTIAENNHPDLGGAPVSLFVIKVDREERFRGAIKTILSDNVFDENIVIRHQGDFAARSEDLVFEWWYRIEDGREFPPPDSIPLGTPNPWKLFTNPLPIYPENPGQGFSQLTLKGSPNAPEILLSDTLFYVRYRHVDESDEWVGVPFEWAGAANSSPKDNDLDGEPDYRPQLVQGWIKRVLDAVNLYEARIRDFTGDSPAAWSNILRQLGAPYVGPVALNPSKNVIENVGLIELYETILDRALGLTVGNGIPVTAGIGNAIELASTRLLDFYTILGNEAYSDAQDPTIGYDEGSMGPAVFAFQNQVADLAEEELSLLRGIDSDRGRPFHNRLFPNFTKGEGEPAYVVNYNLKDVNTDGFIDESDALVLYPQGHGDAWGHYLTALKTQYGLLREPLFNWESRSELYNLLDVVIEVDFRDERKFAATAAAKAKAGAEIVDLTYRSKYVENAEGQWQGYTDTDSLRGWGVEEWARRVGQGAYFDWITSNALLPSVHPNETLEGIAKVDRTTNKDIAVISANLTKVQQVFDNANTGVNPVGVAGDTVPFDINPILYYAGYVVDDEGREGQTHFEQIYTRALAALKNAKALLDGANEYKASLRSVGNTEDEFLRSVFEEDLSYRNRLIEIFGTPYEGTIGSGKLYPPGYEGPDILTWMYVDVREITAQTVPGPTATFGGDLVYDSTLERYSYNGGGQETDYSFLHSVAGSGSGRFIYNNGIIPVRGDFRTRFAPTFIGSSVSDFRSRFQANADVNYTGDASRRVDLQNFNLPIMARGYTFQAPAEWGIRRSPGKLQLKVHEMLQKEAELASAVAAWDGFQGGLWRQIELFNAKFDLDVSIRAIDGSYLAVKTALNAGILTAKLLAAANEIFAEVVDAGSDAGATAIPTDLPTGGLAVSPGDALSTLRAAFKFLAQSGKVGFTATKIAYEKIAEVTEQVRDTAGEILDFTKDNLERDFGLQEALVELENMIGDEAKLRIEIFKELEGMRQISDEFRSEIAEGQRLIDEREAYNKRVAVQAQKNRYDDITFRVARNSALQNYKSSFDLAVRYAYLAAKAYDYETSLPENHAASAMPLLSNIVGARYLGALDDDGAAKIGGGLAGQLAIMKGNFATLRNQLGIITPSNEYSRLSIRHELLRLHGEEDDDDGERWREALMGGSEHTQWVDDLWTLPEFRRFCRPFAPLSDGEQPGLVISFGTSILPGENVFGQIMAGGDHTFNVSDYATKIRGVGVLLEGYDNTALAQTPRVYLVPAGVDFQRMPYSDSLEPRAWNVIDAKVPVPYPVGSSLAGDGGWIPLVDSLSEPMGEPRRYSMFRAYYSDPESDPSEFDDSEVLFNSRLGGRSVWNNRWLLIIPGLSLHAQPEEGLRTLIEGPLMNPDAEPGDPDFEERDPTRAITDIRILIDHFGFSGN